MKHYEKPMAQLVELCIEEDLLTLDGNTSLVPNPFDQENG